MKTRLENILVDCLCDTLNVMLCSESSGTICTIHSQISRYPIVGFFKANSAETMKSYLRQIHSWHCLIIDSRCSFSEEFFASMRDFPLWMPIIVLADYLPEEYLRMHGVDIERENYPHIQNIIINNGMYNYFKLSKEKKCITVCSLKNIEDLFPLIQTESIKKKLIQKLIPEGVVENALNVLFKRNPISVEEWSLILDSTPRKFQRIFKNFTFYSPKKLITLYHAYRIAFETIGKNEEFCKGIVSAYILDERSKKRVMEYVLSRRSQLLLIKE